MTDIPIIIHCEQVVINNRNEKPKSTVSISGPIIEMSAQDAESFKKSEHQIVSVAARALANIKRRH